MSFSSYLRGNKLLNGKSGGTSATLNLLFKISTMDFNRIKYQKNFLIHWGHFLNYSTQ